MILTRVLCIIIGYFFGIFQTGYFYGKSKGIDIREHGSGNSGATNTLRVLGTKAGIIVLLGDALKCVLATVLIHFLFGADNPEMDYLFRLYGAFGVILGHNFPFYLHFRGGKGIAATAGLILSFGPLYTVINLTIFCTVFFTTHFVSVGSMLVYVGFLVETIILGQLGYLNGGIIPQAVLIEMYCIIFVMTVMAFIRHGKNINRLMHGTESKVYLSKKGKEKAKEKSMASETKAVEE